VKHTIVDKVNPMNQGTIRASALCVIRSGDQILVALGYTSAKGEFFRPLGGGINFGEPGRDAVVREIREEIGAEVTELRYLGLIENFYTRGNVPMHELALIYEAQFVDQSLNQRTVIQGMEEDGMFEAEWIPFSDFTSGQSTLFPEGLLDLLTDVMR